MNYLAHALLANKSAATLVGGLMGDFVKGRISPELPGEIRHGILEHRSIDRFTDTHVSVLASKRLVSPLRRRFAGIMVDVFFDHFLARHWERFADYPLQDFTAHVYGTLYRHWHLLPDRLQQVLTAMASEDWLASYRDINAIHASINGISLHRLRRQNSLHHGAVELERNYTEFEAHFHVFFPDLVGFARSMTREQQSTASS
jgi:acyl carrier protein phosphodiesterase